jgi:hypothetical protein
MNGSILATNGLNTAIVFPISVDFAAAGSDFHNIGDALSTGLEVPVQYLNGPYKVAAIGIEVCNTTAEIYQQGLATCSRMNQTSDASFTTVMFRQDGNFTFASSFPVRTPPKNLSEAILLPNTTQWHAKEGCYSVVELQSIGTRPPSLDPVYPIYMPTDFPPAGPFNVSAGVVSSTNLSGVPVFILPPNPGHVPMNTTTQMFTGLSDQTTLTLRVRWVFERYPNDNQPEILVLATPSAAFDPIALEIYSRLMRKIPPGVMFKDNLDMDWWKTVLAGLADVAGSGLMMMPHPLAQGAGGAIKLLRNAFVPDVPRVVRTPVSEPKRKPKQAVQGLPNKPAVRPRPQKSVGAKR